MASHDPYLYPNTDILINKEDIRDVDDLQQFERVMTAQRLREGTPFVELSISGYRSLRQHLFQDVYEWAGQFRTVDIAKDDSISVDRSSSFRNSKIVLS